jgi:hypothetical protein
MSKLISTALDQFFETIPPQIQYFGMGGDVAIPTAFERALLNLFEKAPPHSREELVPIAHRLTQRQAYLLGAFSVRMATLAVRTKDIKMLCAGTFGLVIDDNLLDWRDVLLGLSVIEDSACRLGADLGIIIVDALHIASIQRRQTITEYLARDPTMRGIKVMRIEALGDGDTFRYRQVAL